MKEATLLRERGDTPNALARLQDAAERDPKNANVLAEMAMIYESIQNFDRSADTWRGHFEALEAHHFSSLGLASDRGLGLVAGYRAACDMALWVVDYFHEFFSPLIHLVIVEQGPEQTVDSSGLPGDCKYVFRQDRRPFNRALCFKEGISAADPSRRLFILSDDDIYLETLDIRANLLMCERYGGAAGFNRIIDLSNENSRALHATKTTRGIGIARDPATTGASREGVCCFLNRESTRNLEAALEEIGQLSSSQANEGRRMFASPNHALRLCS